MTRKQRYGHRTYPGTSLRLGVTVVAVMLLATVLPATTVGADHDGIPLIDNRIEGELFTGTIDECDPDYDRERTRVQHRDELTRDEGVFLPHNGCAATYDDVEIPLLGIFAKLRYYVTGDLTVYDGRYEVRVLVDGEVVAKTEFDHEGGDHSLHLVRFDPASWKPVPPGRHDVRIEYTVLEGKDYMNLNVDYVEGLLPGCVNLPPDVPDIAMEGGAAGGAALAGEEVRFHVHGAEDPDDDALDISWDVDGDAGVGAETVHRFEEPGRVHVKAVVNDEASDCPEIGEFTVERTRTVRVLPGPAI